jgi:endonuclease-8
VPEGDTIFRAARTLHLALVGQTVTRFETVLPRLSRIDEDHPLKGRTVESVTANGKWMLMHFSRDLTLVTHMRMNGSWHIYRPGEAWRRGRVHVRIVIETAKIVAVGFDIPVAEFHTAESLASHPALRRLGPDVLQERFDPAEAATRLRAQPDLPIGEALLRQSALAGIGNVYKSEICFACRVNPFRKIESLSTAEMSCLLATARKFLLANVTEAPGDQIVTYTGFRRTTGRANPSERLWVYGRRGQPCRGCGTAIQSRKQGLEARPTFWCAQCQPPS